MAIATAIPPASEGETIPAAAVGLGAGASAAMATLRRDKMAKMTTMRVACTDLAIAEEEKVGSSFEERENERDEAFQ